MKFYLSGLLVVLLVLGLFIPVWSQGEATALFLMINPGARQGGMGEAGVALANDANAVYWNPAGLAFQYEDPAKDHRIEGTFMHVNWLPQFQLNDLAYEYLAGRMYIQDIGMVGMSIQFMNYGENIQTDVTGAEVGRFNSNEIAVTGSYALKVKENLGVGVNLKFIYSNLAPRINVDEEQRTGRASTFAVDLGVLYHPSMLNRLSVGANLSNIGPKLTYIDKAQADPLPTNLRLGLAYRLLDTEFNKLTLVYDLNRLLVHRRGTSADNVFKAMFYSTWTDEKQLKRFNHSIGAEYWYSDLIALRAGYFYEDPEFGDRQFVTVGFGLRVSIVGVDVSYILGGGEENVLAETLRFSLLLRL